MEHNHVGMVGQHFNHCARLNLFTRLLGRTGPGHPKVYPPQARAMLKTETLLHPPSSLLYVNTRGFLLLLWLCSHVLETSSKPCHLPSHH